MTNFEYYKKEILECIQTHIDENMSSADLFIDLSKLYEKHRCVRDNYSICEMINWFGKEYKTHVLDNEEKEYLSFVVRPFKNKIKYIKKSDYEGWQCVVIDCGLDLTQLPKFKANTMYRGMEVDRKYSLKELGL